MAIFRLLGGRHVDNGPDGKEVTYFPGDVFHSKSDLLKMNSVGYAPKFEKLPDNHPLTGPGAVADAAKKGFDPKASNTGDLPEKQALRTTLETMSLKDLQAHAAAEEIDTKGAQKKEDLVRIILAAS